MNTTFRKEAPIILIALLPVIYLVFIWNTLPATVPIHWNIKGEIDRYGNKMNLLIIALALPVLMYVVMLIIPAIDPKAKLAKMGNKLQNLKFLLTTFMSLLALWILYSTKNKTIGNPNIITMAIGILFLILGNYFKTIQPNYFMGIRTPWTLESETNWKETHKLAGKLWFAGGFAIAVLGFILSVKANFIAVSSITGILVIVPVVYSNLVYRREKKVSIS